jgi:hypothetical protein
MSISRPLDRLTVEPSDGRSRSQGTPGNGGPANDSALAVVFSLGGGGNSILFTEWIKLKQRRNEA